MIKVGIAGGETPTAGELIRLLVHHPEVELINVFSPELKGIPLHNYHKGLIGECNLNFSDSLNYDQIDVLFVMKGDLEIKKPVPSEIKIVYFQNSDNLNIPDFISDRDLIPGVSEMYRKRLVRGGTTARILTSYTSLALIGLFPLALHLLLNDTLRLTVNVPQQQLSGINVKDMKEELESQLHSVQLSFDRISEISVQPSNLLRASSVEIEFECAIAEEELEKIYNDIYDDHNFTFVVNRIPNPTEVAATQKCLIYINKAEEGKIKISVIGDSYFRGGAGDAIHTMNLLFGLYEKTGLSFPASLAFKKDT